MRTWQRPLLAALWLLLVWLMFFHGLGAIGLLGPDEPRYAAAAAQMAASHDFITPRLWDAPFIEKPILWYWMAAAADLLLHGGDAAVRLPNAALALLLSLAAGLFLARVASPRAGILAAFLLPGTTGIFAFARAASIDMALTAPLTICLMALYLAGRFPAPGWYPLAAAALALATLAKGPVAIVLAALAWIGWLALRRDFAPLRAALAPLPVAVFAAIAVPWYALVWVRNPDFGRVFFLQHNLERFATNLFQHPQPFWYYVPVLLLGLFPWTGWLALPLLRCRTWTAASLEALLALWAAAPLLLFTLSRSKLPGYILPAVPALVLLIALEADRRWDRLPRWALAASAALAALVPAAIRLLPQSLAFTRLRLDHAALAAAAPAVLPALGCALLLAILVARRRQAAVLIATLALVAGGVFAATRPPLSDTINLYASALPLEQIRTRLFPRATVVAWQLNRSSLYGLEYYLGHPIPELTAPPAPGSIVVTDAVNLKAFAARFGPPQAIWMFPRAAILEAGP